MKLSFFAAMLATACVSVPDPPPDASCSSISSAIAELEASEAQRATNRAAGFLALGLVVSFVVPFGGFALIPIDLATARSEAGERLDRLKEDYHNMSC